GGASAQVRSVRSGATVFRAASGSVGYKPQVRKPQSAGNNISGSRRYATGVVIYADSWGAASAGPGFYQMPLSGTPSSLELIKASADVFSDAGSLYFDGKYFAAFNESDYGYSSVSYYVIDVNTGLWIDMGMLDRTFKSYSMTYDEAAGIAYGSFGNTSTGKTYFGTFNPATAKVTRIKDYSDAKAFFGMGLTPAGTLVAIDKDGGFYEVDKTSGEISLIAETGIATTYSTAGAVDPTTGRFYYASSHDANSAFYEIDPITGNAVKLYDLPGNEELGGLFFAPDPVADGAPGAPSGLSVDFAGTALDGTFGFTMPSELHDGSAAQGEMSYAVFVDNVQVASGKASHSEGVSVPVSVDAAGTYEFAVVASNEAGEGDMAAISAYIGPDVPAEVTDVRLKAAGGMMELSWSEPSGAHGGILAPGSVVYRVVRCPEGVTVASALNTTFFSEPYAEPESGVAAVYYTVEAICGDAVTAPVASNSVVLGSADPPCRWSLDTMQEVDIFTILDANADNSTWEWDKRGYMGYYYNRLNAADDYLVLPPVRLIGGMTYALSFDAYRWDGNYRPEKVAAYVGRSPEASAMTRCVIEPVEVTSPIPVPLTGNYEAPADGIYYFAVKACSEADCFALYVDNIAVSAPMSANAPAAPSDLKAVADANGALSVEISFTAPDRSLTGALLGSLDKVEVTRGETLVGTLYPSPGQKNVVCSDNAAPEGWVSYTVTPYGEGGAIGESAAVSVFVGHDLPAQPSGLVVTNGVDAGDVVMRWERVTADVNGTGIAADQVTYTVVAIVQGQQELLAEGLTDTEFSFRACDAADEQEFLQFAVFAVNSKGAGTGCASLPFAVGAPYGLPFCESFADGAVTHAIATVSDGAVWWTATDDVYEGAVTAQDGDNGFAVMSATSTSQGGRLLTGVISLDGAAAPELEFWYFTVRSDDENTLAVSVSEANANSYMPLCDPITLGGGEGRGWVKVVLPLADYAGRDIQLCFEGEILKYEMILVDNIVVSDKAAAVSATEMDSAAVVSASNGLIAVGNADGLPVSVSDMSGRIVASASGNARIAVAPGVYLVKVGAHVFRIAVP
ncbi:MAG: hypothetical protein K2H14_07015, partial [Muribaculaceae bacterium]|nr:hypothetical protein [Muribaculaceae bacterium]